jgi:hypothetical protein
MVHKADDGAHAQVAQVPQSFVGLSPVARIRSVWRDVFPQDWVAERGDAEGGKAIEIIEPMSVPGSRNLVVKAVADPVDRALDTAPELERAHAVGRNSCARSAAMTFR